MAVCTSIDGFLHLRGVPLPQDVGATPQGFKSNSRAAVGIRDAPGSPAFAQSACESDNFILFRSDFALPARCRQQGVFRHESPRR
jgi:hypothetical protein